MSHTRTFRLPSGAIVRRKDLSAGIIGQLGVGEVAYVIGARLRGLLKGAELPASQVVRWQGMTEELAEAMQRSIGSQRPIVSLTDDDMRFRFGDFSPISSGQTVVLLTDTLLTGRTVTRILRIIRRMEGIPIAIAAVLDGRVDCGAPVLTFGDLVPVVSCLSQTVVVNEVDVDLTTLENVDRVNRQLDDPYPVIEHPVSPDTFLSWLRSDAESGIFVGHIDRGRSRHFSTYLNVGRLVATHPGALDSLEGNIVQALARFDRAEGTVRVIYPATEGEYANRLASAVAVRLSEYYGKTVDQVPAKRPINSDWNLEAGPWAERFVAVIIDWGAVTTATIRRLMSLAARNGASVIHAVALTSQLDEEAEWQLRSEASIVEFWKRPVEFQDGVLIPSEPTASMVEVKVPVSAAMICRVPMGMAASSECHLCKIARQLRRYEATAPTHLLRQHASSKFELYRPRSRPEFLRLPASDLVGGPLNSEDAAEIWNAHLLLEDARFSTAARAEVRSKIRSWQTETMRESEAWIRLLTVEGYWLDQPPLDANDIRSLIAYACINILIGPTRPIGRRELRWQAATVLRCASKRVFVERFGELLDASVEDEVVAAELCLGMYSLLQRPYNQTRPVMAQVLSALLDARDRLIERRRSDAASKEILFTIDVLHRQAVEIQTRVAQPGDALSAWHALQSSYVMPMNTHTGALTGMLVVLNAFSGPAATRKAESIDSKPDKDYWSEVADAWTACWEFLASSVFPYLSLLKDLFEASISHATWLGGRSLLGLNSERAERFASELSDLEQDPSRFTPGLRRALEGEAFAWFEALLRGKETRLGYSGKGAFQGCLLLRLVSENPCELAYAWDLARGRAVRAGLSIASVSDEVPRGEIVFCSRSLLVEAFDQILDNAAGEKHRAEGRPSQGVDLEVVSTLEENYVKLRIRNNWSQSKIAREGGLAYFANELAIFGGSLEYEHIGIASPDRLPSFADWTYEVNVVLRRWKADRFDVA
jgi:adenine/guanine phosphoribosyltransferase-like PRPP-binding protein